MRLNNDEASGREATGRRCIKQLGDIRGPFPAEAYFYSNAASGSKEKVSLSAISTAALRLVYTLHVSSVEWMLRNTATYNERALLGPRRGRRRVQSFHDSNNKRSVAKGGWSNVHLEKEAGTLAVCATLKRIVPWRCRTLFIGIANVKKWRQCVCTRPLGTAIFPSSFAWLK